jgi:hypothetical protein
MSQRGTRPRSRIRRLGVHVLGAADLDVRSPEFAAGVAELEALPDGERWARLTRAPQLTSPAEGRFAMTPLHAALEAGCDGLLLLATRQEPPHAGDTWRLAELVRPLLHRHGVVAAVVEVHALGLEGFRAATKRGLERLFRHMEAEEVVLIIAGGAKLAFVGALLGLVQAGRVPRLLEPPHEGEPLPPPRELQLNVSLRPWLVRTHQYEVLAELAEIDAAERRAWRALAAAQALDWRALGAADVERSDLEALCRRHPEIPVPDLPCPLAEVGEKPSNEVGWRWYRRTLQASLLVRAAADLQSALYLARPWTECRVRELAFRDLANRDHPKLRALDNPQVTSALGLLLERPQDLNPGPVRDLLENQEVQALCWLGSGASHGKMRQHDDWRRGVRGQLVKLAEDLAPDCLPPVAEELLVVLPVGETTAREERGWSAELQAEAALRALTDHLSLRPISNRLVHLRLVTSPAVRNHARRIQAYADDLRFRSTEVIEVDAEDIEAATTGIARGLEEDRHLVGCAEVLLVTGPGTKPMNVAVALGGGEWGSNRALPVRVANLKENEAERSSWLEVDRDQVLPRLGPDRVVAPILLQALRQLRLDMARQVLNLASYRWRWLQQRVLELEARLVGPRRQEHGHAEAKIWFPARARAFATLARSDPWRAIYATCAAAEAAWPSPRQKGGGYGPSPWRLRSRPRGYELWRVRNDGPFGHRVWALPPPESEVRRLIEGVIEEVRQRPLDRDISFRADDAIVRLLRDLERDVRRVAEEPGLMGLSLDEGE